MFKFVVTWRSFVHMDNWPSTQSRDREICDRIVSAVKAKHPDADAAVRLSVIKKGEDDRLMGIAYLTTSVETPHVAYESNSVKLTVMRSVHVIPSDLKSLFKQMRHLSRLAADSEGEFYRQLAHTLMSMSLKLDRQESLIRRLSAELVNRENSGQPFSYCSGESFFSINWDCWLEPDVLADEPFEVDREFWDV